jgi:hypothetical protein
MARSWPGDAMRKLDPWRFASPRRASMRSKSRMMRWRSYRDSVRPTPDGTEVEAPTVKVVASRKRASVATQTSVRLRRHTCKSKTKAGSSRESRPGVETSSRARDVGPTRSFAPAGPCSDLLAGFVRRSGASGAEARQVQASGFDFGPVGSRPNAVSVGAPPHHP